MGKHLAELKTEYSEHQYDLVLCWYSAALGSISTLISGIFGNATIQSMYADDKNCALLDFFIR